MDKSTKAEKFRDIFQNSLKITSRSVSVKTLLSERNLRRIDYSPYYQRNFVWDNEKKTFFIESVILGTEIPPIILFKAGTILEVIDGRQRFETLKTFKENDFSLTPKGLKELGILKGLNFNKLEEYFRNVFLESNIRIFEFEVINHPNLSDEIVDKVKKEIFRRYNTGITPLSRDELDNAKYDTDVFSEFFKEILGKDEEFRKRFVRCFFPRKEHAPYADTTSLSMELIRRSRILFQFPISRFGRTSEKDSIIDILYDFANSNSEDIHRECIEFLGIINKVLDLHDSREVGKYARSNLLFETVLWAYTVLKNEDVSYIVDEVKFSEFLKGTIDVYTKENFHFYAQTYARYKNTAQFFSEETGINFDNYLRSSNFGEELKSKRQSAEDTTQSIDELSNLRLHKPNPTSIDISEIREDLKSTNYLVRPSYQRQEKINQLKASSLIESILLSISLPPIFVFKKKNSVKEVVDGQQRLLSIIGFMGDYYLDENGKQCYSKNNNFKLKGLKVLNSLEGLRFSDLDSHLQDKILDFVIDVIVIEEVKNESFDPIDLFIRLNYKPYPIKQNSFEMWNSTVDSEVIQKIKKLSNSSHSSWFFLRQKIAGRPDRMLNEELLITLAFMCYKKDKTFEDVVGLFPRQDTITCRLKDKKSFNDFLFDLDSTAYEKSEFLNSINKVESTIDFLYVLLGGDVTKESFNEFLNINQNTNFRRTLQDFYVIWLILMYVDFDMSTERYSELLADIQELLVVRFNPDNNSIDDNSVERFLNQIKGVREKYSN